MSRTARPKAVRPTTTGERVVEPSVPTQLGVGAMGGVIGGLLGGGSGVFYVPVLEKITNLSRHTLHGTAGAANIAVTGVGAATFGLVGGRSTSEQVPEWSSERRWVRYSVPSLSLIHI